MKFVNIVYLLIIAGAMMLLASDSMALSLQPETEPETVIIQSPAAVLKENPEGYEPIKVLQENEAESPTPMAQLAPEPPEPVITRPSARRIVVEGATYAKISPSVMNLSGFGVPVQLADIVVAMGDGTPIIFEVDPDVHYSIQAAVQFNPPDSNLELATAYSTHEVPSERVDRIQALLAMIMEVGEREAALGDITFFEVVEALNRLGSEDTDPDPPVAPLTASQEQ